MIGKVRDRRVMTYGFSAQADVRGENIRSRRAATVSTPCCASATGANGTIDDIFLPMPGRHNVQNALAAIAVAIEMGCER